MPPADSFTKSSRPKIRSSGSASPPEWRVGEVLRLHFVKPIDGRSCQVVLAFKIMEESALGHPCFRANFIDGGRVEPAMTHETDAGIEEFAFRFRQLFYLRSI